jgi:hypothetical protein
MSQGAESMAKATHTAQNQRRSGINSCLQNAIQAVMPKSAKNRAAKTLFFNFEYIRE